MTARLSISSSSSSKFHNDDEQPSETVSYEEIVQIASHRHDYERFGDSDTY